ncbi:unnamed protein product [Rotaria sp. Silwood1]|nr:unnamed protein product [Rotaria sp. Silwood1]CAF3725083.1 unnamed protein product [Rotaria sp. Silwood1]
MSINLSMIADTHDRVQENRQNASRFNSLTHIVQFNYDDHWKEIEINLQRPSGLAWGFSIGGGTDVCGINGSKAIVVRGITKGGPADRDQQLKLYDIILRVNNMDFTNIKHQVARDILRTAGNHVNLLIRRLLPPILEEIQIEKLPNTRWDLLIEGGIDREYIEGDHGIFIRNIIPETIADKNGRLRVGDRLMHIRSSKNSYDLTYVERQQAIELIRHACNESQTITLLVAHPTDLKIFDDVVGLKEAKEALEEAIILPVKFPNLFRDNRKPWSSILLYGPAGTGKSYLAKTIQAKCEVSFISVNPSDIFSKWFGESERNMKDLFKLAHEQQPCIVFIDHIDSLCSKYNHTESESSRRVKTDFLVQMQSIAKDNSRILILATTNIPWALDTDIQRSFQKRIYTPLPDVNERAAMFKIYLSVSNYHTIKDDEWAQLARKAEHYSGADIDVVCREALLGSIRRLGSATHFKKVQNLKAHDPRHLWLPCSPRDPDAQAITLDKIPKRELCDFPVTMEDMIAALATQKPTVSRHELLEHERFNYELTQRSS